MGHRPKMKADYTGKRFGILTGIKQIDNMNEMKSRPKGFAAFLWQCDCGNTHEARVDHVRSGTTISCGCESRRKATERIGKAGKANRTHGLSGTKASRASKFSNVKAKKLGESGRITPVQVKQLWESHGYSCYYCNQQTKNITLDHYVPFALGGSNTIHNCVPACKSCNYSKNDRHPHDFEQEIADDAS